MSVIQKNIKPINRNVVIIIEFILYAIIGYLAIKYTELYKMTLLQQLFFYTSVVFMFIHFRLSYFVFKNLQKGNISINKAAFYAVLLVVASLIAQSNIYQFVTTWFEIPEDSAKGIYFKPQLYKHWIGSFNFGVLILSIWAYFSAYFFNINKNENKRLIDSKYNFVIVVSHLFVLVPLIFCEISIFKFDLFLEKVLPYKILYVAIFYLSCIVLHYYKRYVPSYLFFVPFLIIPVIIEYYLASDAFMAFVIAPYYLFVYDLFHGNVKFNYGSSKRVYMKTQLSSHYLLNSMNLIYSRMLTEKNEEAKVLMGKFIEQMKYITYDADEMKIDLKKEINFINDYIEIMRGRMISGENITLEIKLPNEIPDRKVPPLLLLPPVENMFKHGISKVEKSILKLDLSIEKGKLILITKNTKNNRVSDIINGGKGLKILKDNLEFMYPGKHKLVIEDKNESFYLYLRIKL